MSISMSRPIDCAARSDQQPRAIGPPNRIAQRRLVAFGQRIRLVACRIVEPELLRTAAIGYERDAIVHRRERRRAIAAGRRHEIALLGGLRRAELDRSRVACASVESRKPPCPKRAPRSEIPPAARRAIRCDRLRAKPCRAPAALHGRRKRPARCRRASSRSRACGSQDASTAAPRRRCALTTKRSLYGLAPRRNAIWLPSGE